MSDTAHLHPLAQVFVIPSSVSVIEGGASLEHLNRILSVETLELPLLARKDGLICYANGRILDSATICNLGSQVIILGNNGTGDETRQTIASGITWDEELGGKDALADVGFSTGEVSPITSTVDGVCSYDAHFRCSLLALWQCLWPRPQIVV